MSKNKGFKLNWYNQFNNRQKFILKRRKTPFIWKFTKTPPGIVCPHFYILGWAFGCPFECSYCYLIGTSRGRTCREPPIVYSNQNKLFKELEAWLDDINPKVLNTGELTDSLAITDEVIKKLILKFNHQQRHKLLLLTKSANVDGIIKLPHNRKTIVSFSVNPEGVIEKFERGASKLSERVIAAEKCKASGYPIRIRVDPMIPIENWNESYSELAEIINAVEPERVTLGSLRFFDAVPVYSGRDKSIFKFGEEKTADGRWRVPRSLRLEMYQLMLDKLKVKVSLCKETVDVIRKLKLPQKCNCVL